MIKISREKAFENQKAWQTMFTVYALFTQPDGS
jgi:hypothetical protein